MKKSISIALLLVALVASIISAPEIALHAAKSGFTLWWSYLFPVLLPMYMLTSLCLALGLFHSISYVIIRLFRLPNTTVDEIVPFVYRWFVGATYIPYDNRLEVTPPLPLSSSAVQKYTLLYTLSYNANPIFIIVVIFSIFVPLSFIGVFIVLSLLCATFICGLFLRLRYTNTDTTASIQDISYLTSLEDGRKKDGRPIGKLLGEGIYDSVQQLFLLGGVMLFTSVVAAYLQALLPLHTAFQFSFVIEQHVASYSIIHSNFQSITMLILVMLVLSFGGIAQLFIVHGNFQKLQLNFFSFIRYRLIHTLISVSFILVNLHWIKQVFQPSATRHVFEEHSSTYVQPSSLELVMTSTLVTSCSMLAILVCTIAFISSFHRRNRVV